MITAYVSFLLNDGTFENMHAIKLHDGAYILANSPFYAYDISLNDIVSVIHGDNRIIFKSVKKRGGHSTYRIKLFTPDIKNNVQQKIDKLVKMGCAYESSSVSVRKLYAVDVPPNVDVQLVYDILDCGEQKGLWEFEEAHFFKGYTA